MTDWLVPFQNLSTRMRTRSGLSYRRSGLSQWSGPSLSRARMAAQRQFSRSRTLTRNRRTTSGIGITTQHDERRIYRKKSMPRRMKRRWRRFKSKVLAVSEKDLGTRTVVFNKTYTFTNSTATAQIVASPMLYGATSTTAYCNDLTNISAMENPGNPTAATGATVNITSKWIFKSAILDITFRNSSTFTADGSNFVADSRAKLETDIYEILVNAPTADSSSNYNTLNDCFVLGTNDTLNIGGGGTGIVAAQRGVTPWDIPAALSRFKMKILKKTKFMTPNGDTFTYQIRDPRRHVCNGEFISSNPGFNIRGWTRVIWIVSKLVPGLTIGTTANTFQESLDAGLTRKYFYKIEGVMEDRDRWVNS